MRVPQANAMRKRVGRGGWRWQERGNLLARPSHTFGSAARSHPEKNSTTHALDQDYEEGKHTQKRAVTSCARTRPRSSSLAHLGYRIAAATATLRAPPHTHKKDAETCAHADKEASSTTLVLSLCREGVEWRGMSVLRKGIRVGSSKITILLWSGCPRRSLLFVHDAAGWLRPMPAWTCKEGRASLKPRVGQGVGACGVQFKEQLPSFRS